MQTSRRAFLLGLAVSPSWMAGARAGPVREIGWNELLPPGVPYSEIIGEGDLDERNDTWLPAFDRNAMKFNEALDGARIRIPGFVLPLETDGTGVTEFILTPYVGACIHVPPPPPNQLVFATMKTPWRADAMWEPVWVTGVIRVNPIRTNLAEIGYELEVGEIETYAPI